MKKYTFNWEIQTLLEQMVSAFNDVIIKRYDKNKNLLTPEDKKVLYVYAPKTRVFNYLNNPAPGGLTVPVIGVNISSIARDQSRVFNKIEGFRVPYKNDDDSLPYDKKILQPVPVNIGVSMTIVTKYQNDMDQIISNFVPYCDPYIVISWKIPTVDPKFPTEIRSEILWDGNIRLNYPLELQTTQPYRITADTSFTIKGWLFKKMDEVINKIYVIDSEYHPSVFDNNILVDIDEMFTDYYSISARPQF
jgi:hypothetical protein